MDFRTSASSQWALIFHPACSCATAMQINGSDYFWQSVSLHLSLLSRMMQAVHESAEVGFVESMGLTGWRDRGILTKRYALS